MVELTPSERRSLALAALLVVAGAGARWGLTPGPASWAWEQQGPRPGPEGLDSLRAAVQRNRERARRAALPLAPGERLDPNTAPTVELDRLPGVGPSTAKRIAEARRDRPFLRTDDLLRVRGIGPVTLEKVRPHLSLPDGPATGPDGRRARDGATGAREAAGGRVDVNRAGPEELERLPEVGPAIARRIVRSRELHGPFRTLEDLLRVPGIGPARLEALRGRATVGGG